MGGVGIKSVIDVLHLPLSSRVLVLIPGLGITFEQSVLDVSLDLMGFSLGPPIFLPLQESPIANLLNSDSICELGMP